MTTPARPANRHHKRPRGEGQWALGYREPLNKNEENKKNDDGLNVRQRIIDVYSKRGLRLHRPGRPARPVPLVRAVHPAPPGHRRRQDRHPGAGGARRPLLHAPGPDRRRPADQRAAARDRRHLAPVRPRHRRRHRPAEHPAALDRDRGRPGDLGAARSRSACPPPRPAATPRGSSSAARWPGWTPTRSSTPRRRSREVRQRYIGDPAFSNLPRKFKSAMSGCAGAVHRCTRSTTSRSSA